MSAMRARAAALDFRVTQHAQQEMAQEAIALEEVLVAIGNGRILENYPDHRRGACCLVHGTDRNARDIHIVCTMGQSRLIIVTVYLPKPPKWISPTQRSKAR
jgi:uncharacterized protein DUF4258